MLLRISPNIPEALFSVWGMRVRVRVHMRVRNEQGEINVREHRKRALLSSPVKIKCGFCQLNCARFQSLASEYSQIYIKSTKN